MMTINKDVFLNELKNFKETGQYDFIQEKLTEEEVWKFAFLVAYILGGINNENI